MVRQGNVAKNGQYVKQIKDKKNEIRYVRKVKTIV